MLADVGDSSLGVYPWERFEQSAPDSHLSTPLRLAQSVALHRIAPHCIGTLRCVVDLAAKPSTGIPDVPGMWVKGAIQTDPRYVDFSM